MVGQNYFFQLVQVGEGSWGNELKAFENHQSGMIGEHWNPPIVNGPHPA